jgi:histidyl-tRNA synthetase
MFGEIEDLLRERGLSKERIDDLLNFFECKSIEEVKQFVKDRELVQDFEELLRFLESFGIDRYTIDTSIVRGLEYYKGVVFEIELPRLGAENQICGGGSYELLSIFGEKSIPTAGFAMGFDRIMVALEEKISPKRRLAAYVIPISIHSLKYAIEVVMRLRDAGIITDIDLNCRGLSKALKYASSLGTRRAIIVGEREEREKRVTIRDMESGKQEMIDIERVKSILEGI